MTNETLERQIIQLIAADRIGIPLSSLDNKIKRLKPKLAADIYLPDATKPSFEGERVYVRIETDDNATQKARTMKEAIAAFSDKYPRHGKILEEMIAEERQVRETNLYFGVNPGCRLAADDYMEVMQNLGFTEVGAKNFYPELMDVSRRISKARDEERSIMLGTTLG